jgi:RNA polymerase sigma-70 factor (ECF subfamily)
MTDNTSETVKRACTGDIAAYQECIKIYSSRVHAIAYQMVGNSIDAQDIAQEVFIRLYRSLHTYKPQFLFSTWLYRLTLNLSIDYLRKNIRHQNISLEELSGKSRIQDTSPLPEISLEQKELKGAIQQISERLTLNQRKVFVLKDLQGFTTDEAAQILKCSNVTVRVHLSKARDHIKNALKKHPLVKTLERFNQEKKDEM